MKVTQLLAEVENVIEFRDRLTDTSFAIVVRAKKIRCVKSRNLTTTDVFVITVGVLELAQGFSSKQWALIFRTLHEELQNGRLT